MQRAGHKRHFSSANFRAPERAHHSDLRRIRTARSFASTVADPVPANRPAPQPSLEDIIRERIEGRLHGRIRNLKVRAGTDVVVLEGQCSTYYTKQLAQHAAMGILEDEQLENAIVVLVEQ